MISSLWFSDRWFYTEKMAQYILLTQLNLSNDVTSFRHGPRLGAQMSFFLRMKCWFELLMLILLYFLLKKIILGKKNKLRVYYLSWLRNKILHNDPEVEKKQGWTTVGDLEGCVHYKVGMCSCQGCKGTRIHTEAVTVLPVRCTECIQLHKYNV